MEHTQAIHDPVYGPAGPLDAVRQVSDHVAAALHMKIQRAADGASFRSEDHGRHLLSVKGRLRDEGIIQSHFELARSPAKSRTELAGLWSSLSTFTGLRLLAPEPDAGSGELVYWAELCVKAVPMSHARANAFVEELKKVDALAQALQASLPAALSEPDLRKRYEDVDEVLEPILPLSGEIDASMDPLRPWAVETFDYINGAAAVALASPHPVELQLFLALLAHVGQRQQQTLGLLKPPAFPVQGLLGLSKKAPGILVVPAVRLALGTGRYEVENELPALLRVLADSGQPTIFTGAYDELQALFHGGQGGVSDPLAPVVRRVPGDVPLERLTRFAVRTAGRTAGGLSKDVEDQLTAETLSALHPLRRTDQLRLLPVLARRAVRTWDAALGTAVPPAPAFAAALHGLSESFAGLNTRPRVARSRTVQERFAARLAHAGLPDFLCTHLLAQDEALAALVDRLRMEVLTRPTYQPLRYAAQGTPGTGKSQSAVLLAQWLDVPYVNIDAASMPDPHTAASQLLGSGRGIVNSYQSGRLEQVAKHHEGAVVEVSDLDHATPSVRAALGDLFLQPLDTGQAQSAKGALFSCANLIFAFTLNLPDGRDETLRRGVGFVPPSDQEVDRRVASEIKQMLSGAFLSRVGTPILFAPLSGKALAVIVERAVEDAIRAAAERLHLDAAGVVLDERVGARLVASLEASVLSSGARVLVEHGRTLAAQAVLALLERGTTAAGHALRVSVTAEDRLLIHTP